jgi:hypothetical protein
MTNKAVEREAPQAGCARSLDGPSPSTLSFQFELNSPLSPTCGLVTLKHVSNNLELKWNLLDNSSACDIRALVTSLPRH